MYRRGIRMHFLELFSYLTKDNICMLVLWLKRVKLFYHLHIFDVRKYANEPVLKQYQSLKVRTFSGLQCEVA